MAMLGLSIEGRLVAEIPLRAGRTVIGRSDQCDVALPSEAVSRVHATLERRTEGWWLTDRSRNGTRVDGAIIERHLLADGQRVQIGEFELLFRLGSDPVAASTVAIARAVHEEPVAIDETGFVAARVEVRALAGPAAGRHWTIGAARVRIGGPGADVPLDAGLPATAARLRVVRGRALLEPGDAPVTLNGARVREPTPLVAGDTVRIGEHVLAVETTTLTLAEDPDLVQFGDLIGRTAAMRRTLGLLSRMAGHDERLLIVGESGTGKELAARAVHACGPRADGPFVAVNCAAFADQLVESELFGHERGAFTGATARRDGAFHAADQGTLFLDEVGELRIDVQAKLLRALESGEIRRVGSTKAEFPDVRIVAATNRDLPAMVRAGTFREDLWFRLSVLTIRMPPLRERREDVPWLARALLERHHRGAALAPDALVRLERHDWPGNVRELRNVLTRAVVLGGSPITAATLAFEGGAHDGGPLLAADADDPERATLVAALHRAKGNRTAAARDLGLARTSLLYKMKRLGIVIADEAG